MIKISKLIKSFQYAGRGLRLIWQKEQNFRLQIFAGIIVLFLAFYFNINFFEFIIILFLIGIVILGELINTVIERVCDVIEPEKNSRIRDIKDMSAAMVLLIFVFASIVGFIIFLPYLFNLVE